MPVIRIASDENDPNSGNAAAAVMVRTLGMLSQPIAGPSVKGSRPEKTQPTNPNELTIKQHVFPKRCLESFAGQRGRVAVFDMLRGKLRHAKPDDHIFCAMRAWDQPTEAHMKHIEDRFQAAVRPIRHGKVNTITAAQKHDIDNMFALWYMRTRYRRLDAQEVQLGGVQGSDLTLAEEENLEKNGYLFARAGGKMPARQLNGVQLRKRMADYTSELVAALSGWGVIHAQSGEFIVPDIPVHTIIPLSPRLALAASAPDGTILEANVAEINSAARAGCLEYYFARDLSMCPFAS
ncbi:TPA: DUF4238 domain-containing protein [Burkholderia orbicola]|uniref:DUF4238 domain-containing protein n=1 Tax=Burkholderia orbicola TaxID=2978683 RepID=UPI002656DF9F|nr:DUF4238 domain-containing protein [Burkholderia orbicola]MDN7535406.1 DUF4238 domain-containing protein [Burkholderia orbicola]